MQETLVSSLVQEDPTRRRATTAEPRVATPEAQAPMLFTEKPLQAEACTL